MFSSITQQHLDLEICLFILFHSKCICQAANKKVFKKKGYKIMYEGLNCDRKSQLSEILTEPLNSQDSTPNELVSSRDNIVR